MVTCDFCWEARHYKCRGCQCSVCAGRKPKAKPKTNPAKAHKAKRTADKRRTVAAERRQRAYERAVQRERLIDQARVLLRTGMSDKEVAEALGVKPYWVSRNVHTNTNTQETVR